MKQIIQAGQRSGQVRALASKSQAHRQLICAALSAAPSVILCEGMSKDIAATIACLNGLGAQITAEDKTITVVPAARGKKGAGEALDPAGQAAVVPPLTQETDCHLYCGESGSTLRFLLPVVGALGKTAVFHMEGRLPERPLGPFAEELKAHGMQLRQEGSLLFCAGQLRAGTFTLPGNISSQFISGLLMALPLLAADSAIRITGSIESETYIRMTEDAVQAAGIRLQKSRPEPADVEEAPVVLEYQIGGGQPFLVPARAETERDWSNATFFLCMGALSDRGVKVTGLSLDSSQGDKAVLDILAGFGARVEISKELPERSAAQSGIAEASPGGAAQTTAITVRKGNLTGCVIDAATIPDMVPAISAVAAVAEGVTLITHAQRLRIKESDRLQTVCRMLKNLGATIEETADGLRIEGTKALCGGMVDAANDHRIAMAAAVAACACTGDVLVEGAECVSKSYPGFWEDFGQLALV